MSAADGSIAKMGHKTTSLPLRKGDVIRVITPGAGGYGSPKRRPAEKVLQDVMEKKVSIQAAREEYGVVIRSDGGHLEIDWPATQELR